MSTSEYSHGAGDIIGTFAAFRPSTLTALFLIVSSGIYLYARNALNYRHDIEFGKRNGCKPSAAKLIYHWPLALDVLKDGFKAGRDKKLLAFFTKHFDQLSPTAEVRILGGIGFVTQDPENIEALLSTQFEGKLTLDTTIAMILGEPVESFKHEMGDIFSKAFDKASLVTGTRARLGDLYFLYRPTGFFKACETIKNYTYQFALDALQREAESPVDSEKVSFISELHRDNKDLQLVRDQVLNVLIAGRDTTAATLSYAFHLLLRNPKTLETLRCEIEDVVGSEKEIKRAHIQRMPYLHNVLQETLRLYPPVPINTRFCKKTTTLPVGGGPDGRSPLLVREGMPVAYSVYHMQRRNDLYGPDHLAFRPERWDGSELASIGWAYLPFNGGPRLCLGKDFGLMLASCAIVRIIQEHPGIKLVPGTVLEEPGTERQHLTLTLSNAQGCKVILR
ncbi:hypothetical protein IFR04_010201 [Cadophora malorum]|uniref:Cytochrome P450 alkane hydroxylase n=1 Tax=Cadophora malorum TaxID=108018 RepID=A0A8H7W8Y5_9HELO|nr:hypothetical protein IFR04_010201 [Cadophora malorum]